MRAADVIDVADLLAGAVRTAPGHDWSVRAGDLEWDVTRTLEHVAGSLAKYALYLASGTSRYVPLRMSRMAGPVSREDWLHGLAACATAFASAVQAAPVGARAFHSAGMADAEGYAALACAHLMEHGHDICRGLGATFTPPADLCAAVCARLYPWVPVVGAPWTTFLWTVGKAGAPGRPPFDPATPPLLAPLSEWDGTVPRAPGFAVAAYVLEPGTSRWTPVADPD